MPVPATRVPTPDEAEALESMLLAPQGTWTITDNYQTNQYGTLTLTPGESPLRSATDVVAPGQAARDYEAANAARAIVLDDGTNTNLLKGGRRRGRLRLSGQRLARRASATTWPSLSP